MKKWLWLFLLPALIGWSDFGIENQIELHSKYQNLAFGLQDVIMYSRLEGAFSLPQAWQLYLRLDLPFMYLWGTKRELVSISDEGIVVPPEQPGAHTIMKEHSFTEVGLADIVSRFFLVTPYIDTTQQILLGFGSEFGFPSAQEPDLGTGKYWARPLVGVRFEFPHLGTGSSLALLGKYQFSFAGEKHRPSFRIFAFQPVFIYSFRNNLALILSPETQYNVKEHTWFVPLSVNLTKTFTKRLIVSVAYQRGIVTSFPVFQDEVELILCYKLGKN